jgi:hypothetical protein
MSSEKEKERQGAKYIVRDHMAFIVFPRLVSRTLPSASRFWVERTSCACIRLVYPPFSPFSRILLR